MHIIEEKWNEILERVRDEHELGDVSYKTWIQPLKVFKAEDNAVTILVPSEQVGLDYVSKKYRLPIKVSIAEITGLDCEIYFVLPADVEKENQEKKALENSRLAGLNPKYTFRSFVTGKNNEFAHAAALAVAESPGTVYNPLFLYVGVGLGKTHLMNAIAHFILENKPEINILYVTSEQFTNEVIDAIRNGSNTVLNKFREKYRGIDVLLIDDIQFIIGKESTQEEFFHTFETLYGQKKQIVVSSDKPPKDLNILEERIQSRLEMGLIADISSPDYETRMAILRKKMEIDGYTLDNQVVDYIATNIRSNIRELEGCLNKIHAMAVLEKSVIDLPLAERILADIINPDTERVITTDVIISAVADHFNLSLQEIRSQKRDKKYVYPRMIAMYLSRDLTEDSYTTIASAFNKKDHTTVISGCKKIERDIEINPQTKAAVEAIRKKLVP